MEILSNNLTEIKLKQDANGLVPAVVQHAKTGQVLMLGYMNEEALTITIRTGLVTFFSRSKDRIWQKGEESGNVLKFHRAFLDCDADTILVKATPAGPVCHKNTPTCFDGDEVPELGFISSLEEIIKDRKKNPAEGSYTSSLFKKGINKVAQKVGEEAVEVVIEAKDDNDELFLNESADLLYHYLILLQQKGFSLTQVVEVLKSRNH